MNPVPDSERAIATAVASAPGGPVGQVQRGSLGIPAGDAPQPGPFSDLLAKMHSTVGELESLTDSLDQARERIMGTVSAPLDEKAEAPEADPSSVRGAFENIHSRLVVLRTRQAAITSEFVAAFDGVR